MWEARAADPHAAENPHITLIHPKTKSSLGIGEGLVLGPQQIPRSMDAQVLYIKWHRTLHTVGPLASTDSQLQTENTVFNLQFVESANAQSRD